MAENKRCPTCGAPVWECSTLDQYHYDQSRANKELAAEVARLAAELAKCRQSRDLGWEAAKKLKEERDALAGCLDLKVTELAIEQEKQRADRAETERDRLREIAAGMDDGGHWYSQATMDAVSKERDRLVAELEGCRERLAANERAADLLYGVTAAKCSAELRAEKAEAGLTQARAEVERLRGMLSTAINACTAIGHFLSNPTMGGGEIDSAKQIARKTALDLARMLSATPAQPDPRDATTGIYLTAEQAETVRTALRFSRGPVSDYDYANRATGSKKGSRLPMIEAALKAMGGE